MGWLRLGRGGRCSISAPLLVGCLLLESFGPRALRGPVVDQLVLAVTAMLCLSLSVCLSPSLLLALVCPTAARLPYRREQRRDLASGVAECLAPEACPLLPLLLPLGREADVGAQRVQPIGVTCQIARTCLHGILHSGILVVVLVIALVSGQLLLNSAEGGAPAVLCAKDVDVLLVKPALGAHLRRGTLRRRGGGRAVCVCVCVCMAGGWGGVASATITSGYLSSMAWSAGLAVGRDGGHILLM